MRILVTGSNGQIGKELISLLQEDSLLCIDKKSGKNLNDPDVCQEINNFKAEIVFHLAASFDRLIEPPGFEKANFEDNILATYNLLNSIGQQVRQIIFASSYLVYQKPEYRFDGTKIIYESFPLAPRNLIGASKLWAEKAIEFQFPDCIVSHARIFRVYSSNSHCFINHFTDIKKLSGRVNVWNTNGTFDFIHAKDVASALLSLFDQKVSGIFNVGTGIGHSIKDVIDLIGVNTIQAQDMDYTEKCYASIGKIKSITGWEPKITLKEGIKELL